MIYFRCENCAGVVRARPDQAGQPLACTRCGHAQPCPVRDDDPGAEMPTPGRPSGLRVMAGVVALLALGLGAWTAVHVGSGANATAALSVASTAEALQHDILSANVGLPGDPDLMRQFAAINAKYFSGRLPAMPVRWEPRLDEVGRSAGQGFTLEGMFGHMSDRAAILIHPNLQKDAAALARTLSHEMVHARLWTWGDVGEMHGPPFQAELARLSFEGAFTGLVATPDEREQLRVWIEGERGRLDTMRDGERRDQEELDAARSELETAIEQAQQSKVEAAELEALEARRAAYNDRVADAKARADRRTADADELNRQIDRYNLMLSYPDGLDHRSPSLPSVPPR